MWGDIVRFDSLIEFARIADADSKSLPEKLQKNYLEMHKEVFAIHDKYGDMMLVPLIKLWAARLQAIEIMSDDDIARH